MTAWRSLKPKEWEEHTRKWKAARGKNAFYHLKAWVIFFCLVGWAKLNFPNQKVKINFEKSNQTSVRELKMEKEKIWQIKHPVNLASVEWVVVSSTNTMLSSNISALICLRDLLEFRLILKKLLLCTEKYIWSQCDKGDTVNTQWCSVCFKVASGCFQHSLSRGQSHPDMQLICTYLHFSLFHL